MKSPLATHAIWAAVAAGAFAGGWAVNRSSPETTAKSDKVNVNVSGGGASALGSSSSNNLKAPGAEGGAAAAGSLAAGFGGQRSATVLLADYLAADDAVERNALFAQLLLGVDADNAAEIYESLQGKLTGFEGGRDMNLFFQAWGKVDGAAAIAAATEGEGGGRGPGRGRGFNIGGVLAGWASTDPEAAKEWIAASDSDEKQFWTMGLVNGLAGTDPNAAADYVFELAAAEQARAAEGGEEQERRGGPWGRGGDMTQRYMEIVADAQLKNGVSAASSWASTLPDGDLKSAAFDQIAENFVSTDLEGAKAWIAEHATSDYAQRAVREVAEQLGRDDPQTALAWADTLPDTAKASVMSETVGRWTRDDPQAASTYVQGMASDAPGRDNAVQSLANALIFERDGEKRDPEAAAIWASTINDEEMRTETLTNAARSWMREDAAAAAEWLPTSGLNAEQQAAVIESANQRGPGGDFGRGRGPGGR